MLEDFGSGAPAGARASAGNALQASAHRRVVEGGSGARGRTLPIPISGGRRYDTDHFGPIAQLVEQGTFNPLVAGSIPAGPTNFVVARVPAGRRVPRFVITAALIARVVGRAVVVVGAGERRERRHAGIHLRERRR